MTLFGKWQDRERLVTIMGEPKVATLECLHTAWMLAFSQMKVLFNYPSPYSSLYTLAPAPAPQSHVHLGQN